MAVKKIIKSYWPIIVVVLSFSIRFICLLLVPDISISSDTGIYYEPIAISILDGKGYQAFEGVPNITRAPLFPLFLSIIYFFGGINHFTVKLIQIVLDSVVSLIVFIIAKRMTSFKVAYLSSIGYAIYPFSIYLSINILSEPLYIFLLSCSVLFLIIGDETRHYKQYFISGFFIGLATLTRPVSMLLPFFLSPYFLFKYKSRYLVAFIIFVFGFIIVILPWTIRNYKVSHRIIPVSLGGSNSFLQGSKFEFLTSYEEKDRLINKNLYELGLERKGKEAIEVDRIFKKAAIINYKQLIIQSPLNFIKLFAIKFLRFWYATDSGNHQKITLIIQLCYLLPAIWGFIYSFKDRSSKSMALILTLIIVYTFSLHTVMFPLMRYSVPIMPYIIIFSMIGIATGYERIVNK